MSVVDFEQALAEGRIANARTILRGLISSNSSLPVGSGDAYELHARLDPKGVPLKLLTADFRGQPSQLHEAQALFRINGQDDLAFLAGLAAGSLTMEGYQECLLQDMAKGYGTDAEICSENYTLGFPNCLEAQDFILALEAGNSELLRDLLYDGISRSWDHSLPDYDYFLSEVGKSLKALEAYVPPTEQVPSPGTAGDTPMVRFGLPSLLDVPLCVALLEGSEKMLQVNSFSPLQIAQGILRSASDQQLGSGSSIEILSGMSPGQRSTFVSSLYFNAVEPNAETLDCSAQVLEFTNIIVDLLDDLILILPPLALIDHQKMFTACPAFSRHYPLPFLSEAPALLQVLEAWKATAVAIATVAPQRVIQLPDTLLHMSAVDAYRIFQSLLSCSDHLVDQPSKLFVRSWHIMQIALDGLG